MTLEEQKMKKYRVWLEPDIAGVRFEEIIEVPKNATEEEIDELCKDVAFNWIDWGCEPIEEVEE